jgi:hypothetical protein
MISTIQKKEIVMVATVPAKRGRKPAATAAANGGVQSLTRGLKLLEWIAESHSSVALTELAQQAGLPNSTTPPADHHAAAGLCPPGRRAGALGGGRACVYRRQQLPAKPQSAGDCAPDSAQADGRFR